jgi:hypothetical protein
MARWGKASRRRRRKRTGNSGDEVPPAGSRVVYREGLGVNSGAFDGVRITSVG